MPKWRRASLLAVEPGFPVRWKEFACKKSAALLILRQLTAFMHVVTARLE